MKRHMVFAAVALVAVLATTGQAQDQKPAASSGGPPPSTTLRVQLVLSRYQGDKKISSLPYTLTANTEGRTGRANLRLGTQVPITTLSRSGGESMPTVIYKDVGTNIDCIVTVLDEGRYRLNLTVEDSSLDTSAASGGTNTNPAFKSFRADNSLLLKDGQSTQYMTATDKVSGDVWKVDVTLTVVK